MSKEKSMFFETPLEFFIENYRFSFSLSLDRKLARVMISRMEEERFGHCIGLGVIKISKEIEEFLKLLKSRTDKKLTLKDVTTK